MKNYPWNLAPKAIKRCCLRGQVILDYGNHRWIRSGNLFIPCKRKGKNSYTVKSILRWDMVEKRLQRVMDKLSLLHYGG